MKEFAIVQNALLRCERNDDQAHPLFELVREDLGLWVWELGPLNPMAFDEWLPILSNEILRNLDLLRKVKSGSRDFTLHVTVAANDCAPLRIDSRFSEMMHQAGFALEIFLEQADTNKAGETMSVPLRSTLMSPFDVLGKCFSSTSASSRQLRFGEQKKKHSLWVPSGFLALSS